MTLEEVGELVSSATFRTRSETDTAMVEPDAVVPVVPPGPGQQIVLFTDVEGSTRLADLLGDARAQELRRNHDTLTRQALSKYGGAEIKHTGDGFMASFHSVVDALEYSKALQCSFLEHNRLHPSTPIRIRVGLNAGKPVAEDGDLFGTIVNMAARICDIAAPEQILVSNVVRELTAGKDYEFVPVDEVELKGISGTRALVAVSWEGAPLDGGVGATD